MKIKKGQTLALDIVDIAFGGKGLAKVEGFAIFVDQTAPMDQVLARIVKKKKRFADARVVEILNPSPLRVEPPCEYSGICGGCKWQFLDYEKQLEIKTRHVAESIAHIGKIADVTVHPAFPSDSVFGYRNKMEFSCSDRRWLLPQEMGHEGVEPGFALGLHVPGTFYKVLDIKACLLQPDIGNRILETVRQYIKDSDAPVYGLRSHEGFWRFLMLRHSAAYDRWMVNIITAYEDRDQVQPLADHLIEEYPQIVSIVNNINTRKASIAVGEFESLLAGERVLKDRLGAFEYEISANSFFQTNTRGAEKLYSFVKTFAELTGRETVLDLYSGTGTIPIWLSDSASTVTGLEMVESAVADARKNCRNYHVDNCTFIQGDVRETLSQIEERPDVMIIDPPRAGMHPDVVKRVIALGPRQIVYVSCNPSTLARDLDLMREAYEVLEVQPVDLFPHTHHIESITKLRKKDRVRVPSPGLVSSRQ